MITAGMKVLIAMKEIPNRHSMYLGLAEQKKWISQVEMKIKLRRG